MWCRKIFVRVQEEIACDFLLWTHHVDGLGHTSKPNYGFKFWAKECKGGKEDTFFRKQENDDSSMGSMFPKKSSKNIKIFFYPIFEF